MRTRTRDWEVLLRMKGARPMEPWHVAASYGSEEKALASLPRWEADHPVFNFKVAKKPGR